jgi:hypothetical protein
VFSDSFIRLKASGGKQLLPEPDFALSRETFSFSQDFLFPSCNQALPIKFLGLLLPIQPRTRAHRTAFFAFLSYLLKILKKIHGLREPNSY